MAKKHLTFVASKLRVNNDLPKKLDIEKVGNESSSQEHKEEIQVIFRKSVDLLISI